MNPITSIDFYKSGHIYQYPEGTEFVYSNLTPRSSRLAKVLPEYWDEKIVVAGIQAFCIEVLINEWNEEFFSKPLDEVLGKYKRRMDNALGEGLIDTSHIKALHELGYLPVVISAIDEGERVDIKVPVFTIVNTEKEFFWIVNYLETVLSCELWGTMNSATIAYEYRKILTAWANKTGAPVDFVALQGHDFSMRGMMGRHAAAKSGFGHLTSFIGTDTVPAIDYAEDYYNEASTGNLIGCSVPATEHSVMCMGGVDNEKETFRRLFTELYPTGIVSIVSDTWDYWKVITEYLPEFKDEILARQPNAIGLNKVVIRPDSGDPVRIICGDRTRQISEYFTVNSFEEWKEAVAEEMDEQFCDNLEAEDPHYCEEELYQYEDTFYKVTYTPDLNRHDKTYYYVDNYGSTVSKCKFEEVELTAEQKGSIQCMWETFGGTVTEKGYKVLDEHIGLIYGDSITLERAQEILKRLAEKGFASCNVVFGIGSYTYQYNTRDTFGFAMKATCGVVNGEPREIFKDPATDSGTKKSAKGWLKVVKTEDGYVLEDQQRWGSDQGELKPVFINGGLVKTTTLTDIRNKLWV